MTLENKIEKLETLISKMDSESADLNKTVDDYAIAIKSATDILKDLKKVDSKISVLQKESSTINESIKETMIESDQ